MSGRGERSRGGASSQQRAPLGSKVIAAQATPSVRGGPIMNPDSSYRAKFGINGKECTLDCKAEDRFEVVKERIWKSLSLVEEKKDHYIFKTKKFERYFKDFETFARLLAVFEGEDNPRVEALLVKKAEVDLEATRLDVRVKDDGSVPIQGYMDKLSHIAPGAPAERRYFVLKESTLYYYASEAAFYAKEQAVGSIDLSHAQALKVTGLKRAFQLIRMEDGGATGKFVVRTEDELAFKLWLHHLRRMNYQLTKTRGLAASVWVPDKSVDDCMHCDKKFSLTRRKHHCRTCGAVVCGECSPDKIKVAESEDMVRVCKHCRKDYQRELKGKTKRDVKKEVGLSEEEADAKKKAREADEWKELRDEVRGSIKLSGGVEGYLEKQSARGLKPWQKRWCVLDEKTNQILYYKDRRHRLGGAIGEIKLDGVLRCFHVQDERTRFDIVTARKTYAFNAPSPALSSRWVTHINKILRTLTKDPEVQPQGQSAPQRRLKGEEEKKDKPKPKTNIFFEGPLKKMSPSRIFAAFQDRWFVLDQSKGKIMYYKRSPKEFAGEELLGDISLNAVAMCKTDFTDRSKPKFSIWVNTGRQYTLLCRTESEASQWVSSIIKCAEPDKNSSEAQAKSIQGGSRSEPPPRVGGYVEADDEEDIPPPPPPPPGGFRDALPASKVGWPQLQVLEHRQLIPVTLRFLSYLPEADIRRACQVSHFWKVVAEELVQFDDDEDELSDVGDYGGAEDSGSGDEAPESGPAKTKAIVIDNGSCWIRAGFAGDRRPRVIIAQTSAAVIDPSESKGEAVSLDSMHHFLDTKATWKAMEKCWKQVFEKLGVDPSEYKILITQPVFSPNYVKANYLQILFKRFKAQAVYVTDSPVLTAYSYGKYTGMVVDIGLSSVQVCAIIEGYMKENVTRRASYLGGEASTQRMYEFLKYTPLSKINFYEALKIANKIKEQYCFVATDFVAAQKDPKNKVNYKLPNGEEITIQRALPSIGEIYFDPKKALGDRDEQILSLQEMIQATAEASDLDTRKDLLENILISGGESLMPGFVERLEREIKALMPHAASYLKLHADKDRNNAVFNGGAILAGLDMFQKNWIMPWDWAADQPAPAPPRTPASSSAPSGPPPPVPSSASRAKSPARASSPRRNM